MVKLQFEYAFSLFGENYTLHPVECSLLSTGFIAHDKSFKTFSYRCRATLILNACSIDYCSVECLPMFRDFV